MTLSECGCLNNIAEAIVMICFSILILSGIVISILTWKREFWNKKKRKKVKK